MSIIELFIIAIGLSMDAFAVSICKGLSLRQMDYKKALLVALYFGGFQALMPFLGYTLGIQFQSSIVSIDHWVSFLLLEIIGLKMLKEAKSDDEVDSSFGFKSMVMLAIATSIDALAVGVSFAFLRIDIIWAVSLIGITTFIFAIAGVKIGNTFGKKYKAKAEIVGGIILMIMGAKILIEHLFMN